MYSILYNVQMRPKNAKNKSFFHYFVQEYDTQTEELSKKEYFYTLEDIRDIYGISRQTIYNILKNPDKTRFPHYIEVCHVHHSIISHLEEQ